MDSDSVRPRSNIISIGIIITIIVLTLVAFLKDYLHDFIKAHIRNSNDLIIVLSILGFILLIGLIYGVVFISATRNKILNLNSNQLDKISHKIDNLSLQVIDNQTKANSKILNTIDKLSLSSSLPWLKTQKEINDIEEDIAKNMQIWIVTPDLKNDTEVPEIIDIVKKNLEKEVCYTYIIPNPEGNPIINENLEDMERIYAKYVNTDSLKIKLIDKEYFYLMGNMCFFIYNPKKTGNKHSKVYLELPREELKWWIELSDKQATIFKREIIEILKKSREYKFKNENTNK